MRFDGLDQMNSPHLYIDIYRHTVHTLAGFSITFST